MPSTTRDRTQGAGRLPQGFPLMASLLVAVLATTLWHALYVQERTQLRQILTGEADNLQGALVERIEPRILALERMARRWTLRGSTPKAEWEADAALYIAHQPGYLAIQHIDSLLQVHWSAPGRHTAAGQHLDFTSAPGQQQTMATARTLRAVTLSRPLATPSGSKGFLVYVPLFRAERFEGFVAGIFDAERLLTDLIEDKAARGFTFALADGAETIYSPPGSPSSADAWHQERTIALRNVTWQARIGPTAALMRQAQSALPEVVLGAGLLLAFLLALTLHLNRRASLQKHTAKANQDLRAEIAERMRAEEALHTSKHFVERMLRAAPSFIYVIDLTQGRYVYVNDAYARIMGYPRERLLADDGLQFILSRLHPDDAQRVMARQNALLDDLNGTPGLLDQDNVYNFVYRAQDADDAWHWIQSWGVVFETDEAGQVTQILGVAEDITARKEATAEREQLIDELEGKNAELERFAYTVSHDLKSPLVTIKGFLGLLRQDAAEGEDERVDADIQRISDAVDQMGHLLSSLLDLSRVGHRMAPPEDIALADLVREAAALAADPLAERPVQIEIAPDLPTVRGDRVRLLEVYQNLLENAVKFMGDQPTPQVEVGVRRNGEASVYFVRDNGIGIEPQYHDKIFGLFERLDAQAEGTGIGMTLVKRIVELHGGRIWVESTGRGHGTTFCFTLSGA